MTLTETEEQTSQPAEEQFLSFGQALSYSVANLGYGAFYTLNNAILSLYLARFTRNNVIIGLGGSTHSFEGAVIQPLIGAASDRLRSRLGRRRPFMLTAIPISTLFLFLTPVCAGLPHSIRLAAMVACIFLFTVTFNIAQDPYNALMPDITPEAQRGRVTGISMCVFLVGQVLLVLIPEHVGSVTVTLDTKFTICAVLMLATTLITVALVREPEHPFEVQKTEMGLQAIKTALAGLRTLRQARLALVVAFFSGLGIGAVFPFLTLFFEKITGCSDKTAQQLFLYLVATTALFVMPFGRLVDWIGPRVVLLLALFLIASASLAGLWVHTVDQIRIVMIIAGLGNSAQFASAYPLLYQLVPREEVGFYTGLQSTALSVATPITAVFTGMLVNNGGYRSIFQVCSLCVCIAFVVLLTVKRRQAVTEVEDRRLELSSSSNNLP